MAKMTLSLKKASDGASPAPAPAPAAPAPTAAPPPAPATPPPSAAAASMKAKLNLVAPTPPPAPAPAATPPPATPPPAPITPEVIPPPKPSALPPPPPVHQPELEAQYVADTTTAAPPVEDDDIPGTGSFLPARSSDLEGEFGGGDLVYSSLKIVQNIGPLSESFEPGAIVVNGEHVIYTGPEKDAAGVEKPTRPPLKITALRLRKQYAEKLPYGSDQQARVFNTIEEVRAAGGWVEWHGKEAPPFQAIAGVVLVVECPEDIDTEQFPFEFNGKFYGAFMFMAKGTSYTRLVKPLVTAVQSQLKDGLKFGSWELTTRRVKAGTNLVQAPILKFAGRNSPEFVEFLGTLI